MFHLITSVIKVAVAFPLIDGISELVGEAVGLHSNALGDLAGRATEHGVPETIGEIAKGVQWLNLQFANLAAQVCNAVGLGNLFGGADHLLNGRDFTEDFGIIKKVVDSIVIHGPAVATEAMQEQHRNVLLAGTALGIGTIAVAPDIGNGIHDVAANTVSTAAKFGRSAQSALTHAQVEINRRMTSGAMSPVKAS
jgi:hypothetical protein